MNPSPRLPYPSEAYAYCALIVKLVPIGISIYDGARMSQYGSSREDMFEEQLDEQIESQVSLLI